MKNENSLASDTRLISKEVMIGAMKASFGMVPVIGAALDEIFFEVGNRIKANRFEIFVYELAISLKSIEENMISQDYLASEEFYDIVNGTIKASIETNQKNKHLIFANIIKYSILNKSLYEEDLINIFIKWTNELSINHILILKFIIENFEIISKIYSMLELRDVFTEKCSVSIEEYEFQMYVLDLNRYSIIRVSKDVEEFGGGSGYTMADEGADGFLITVVGSKYATFLS